MARRPWQIRCAIDSAKALLPFQNTLRRLKDRAVGYQRNITQDALTIRDGLTLVNRLGDLRGVRVLEVGSGWQPMLPILFSLAGASVFTTDLHRLIRLDTSWRPGLPNSGSPTSHPATAAPSPSMRAASTW
jgi:hypothetical protein